MHSDRNGAGVSLSHVDKSFGDIDAVKAVSFNVPAGSFFSLLGPSGCGKSTTLRLIAGFEAPDSGTIQIGNVDVTTVSAQNRPTAMVFQSYALFPHLSVGGNVGYGLRVKRIKGDDLKTRIESALGRVGLGGMTDLPVVSLSGGQQQRVALARAIAVEPEVLLFDEPLSNLDVALRDQTRRELKNIQATLGTTSIYVTHDQEEAMALSDTIAVMNKGRVIQVGSPKELYDTPKTAFVARFLGRSNILRGTFAEKMTLRRQDDKTVVMIRPEHIEIHKEGRYEATISETEYLGNRTVCWLNVDGEVLRAERTGLTGDIGSKVRFDIGAWRSVSDDI